MKRRWKSRLLCEEKVRSRCKKEIGEEKEIDDENE
jgi:hypothetical protein